MCLRSASGSNRLAQRTRLRNHRNRAIELIATAGQAVRACSGVSRLTCHLR